jgi:hypothetical protein
MPDSVLVTCEGLPGYALARESCLEHWSTGLTFPTARWQGEIEMVQETLFNSLSSHFQLFIPSEFTRRCCPLR